VFVEFYKQTAQWVTYSMDTGERLWTTVSQTDFNALEYCGNIRSSASVAQFAYEKRCSSGFGGVCFCFDLIDGKLLWTYGNRGVGNSTNTEFNAGGQTYYPLFVDVAPDSLYCDVLALLCEVGGRFGRASPTRVARRANLPYVRFQRILEHFVGLGLVRRTGGGLLITEKGLDCLRQLRLTNSMLDRLGLGF
jgi:predicted transcriptional regulator